MNIGISTAAQGISEEFFAKCEKAGITHIELSGNLRDYTAEDLKNVADMAKKHNLTLWSLHLPFYPFDEIDLSWPEYSEHTLEVHAGFLKLGTDIGIKNFIVHSSAPFEDISETPVRMECAKESLKKLAEMADEYGAVIAVETLCANTLPKHSTAMKELLSGSEKLRICLDTNHLLAGEDFPEFLENLGEKLITLHVSDYDYVNERHWLPGEGKIDWQKMMQILRKLNYSGPWLYELIFRPEPTINRDRDLTCEDIVRNAKEIFENKPITILGTPKEDLYK